MNNNPQINDAIESLTETIEKEYYDIYNYTKGGLANGRDLGGIVTKDGRKIKRNRFIRSAKLVKLNKREIKSLKDADVKTIIDLRMDNEREGQPDTVIDGIEIINLPILCVTTAGITADKSMYRLMKEESELLRKQYKNADEYMKGLYDRIMFSEDTKVQFREFIQIILNSKGCVLWHCAAGKDRAGLCAMLVEGLLGADDEAIIADYVASQKSNTLKRRSQKFALAFLTVFTFNFKLRKILTAMLDAKRDYIEHTLKNINKQYGSVLGYCKIALGVTDEQILKFRKDNLI